MTKLVISDLDGTLAQHDVLDYLATEAGFMEESIKLRKSFQSGKSKSTLAQRVRLLSSMTVQNVESILEKEGENLLRANYQYFIKFLKQHNIDLHIVSGNIAPVVQYYRKLLNAKKSYGTEIITSKNKTIETIDVNKIGKTISNIEKLIHNIDRKNIIYMGDDISDLPFFKIFEMNISFEIESKYVNFNTQGDFLDVVNIIKKIWSL